MGGKWDIFKSRFVKDGMALVGGNAWAQGIAFAAYLVLTRLYTPEDFGLYNIFYSYIDVLIIVSTFKYEMAVVVADNDREAAAVSRLALRINTAVSLLLLTVSLVCYFLFPFSVFNAIFCIFRSLGDTRSSLLLTIVINVAHLLLSLLLINGFHLGVDGSGFSYIIARTLGMGLAVVWLLTHNVYHVRIGDMLHFRPAVTKQIAALGLPLALESMLTQGGMLLVQVYLARLTTTDLAAHAVSNSILNLFAITGSALVSLSSTVCGQCFGAKRPDLTWHYTRNIIRIGRVIQLCTLLILYPLMPLLLRLYHATEQGTAIVYTALTIAAAAMPFFWCDSNVLPMTLRIVGSSHSSTKRLSSLISLKGKSIIRCRLE